MGSSTSLFVGAFAVLALLAPTGACMPNGEPVVIGNSGAGGGGNLTCTPTGGVGETNPDAPPTFATVRMHIANNCGGVYCHVGLDDTPLDLFPPDDATLYTTLTTHVVSRCSDQVLVKPCAPEQSAFYQIQIAPCEQLPQMPFGCDVAPNQCLTADAVEPLRQWIALGAPPP